jgi:uncharacterized protein (TIGR00369 family)
MTTIETGSPGHNEALGVALEEVTADRVTLTMVIGPQHHQPYGIVHGGVWCALVETAASVAAATWLADRGRVVGVSNHTDFLRAVGDGVATATATRASSSPAARSDSRTCPTTSRCLLISADRPRGRRLGRPTTAQR